MTFFNKKITTAFYLAFLSFGLSLCFSLQLANLSSVFQFLGASGQDLPLLWLAPPLTGLFIQPIIGQMSDDTQSKYGKRLPYIFFWGLLASFTLCLVPFVSSLYFMVIFTLVIDASLNGSTEALRALTGDIYSKTEQQSRIFALQAFAGSLGGALGAGSTYLIYHATPYLPGFVRQFPGKLPHSTQLAFLFCGILLLIVTIISIKRIKERPFKYNVLLKKRKSLSFKHRVKKTIFDFYYNLRKMPLRFRKICLIHAISWIGIFTFWLYFNTTIVQLIYKSSPDMNLLNQTEILKKASLDTSFYFSIYQYVSIIYAVVLYVIAKNNKNNIIFHAISLVIGGLGVALIPFAHEPRAFILIMIAYGIMWGSVLVLPYAIVVQNLPRGKMGVYLGIFNMCITAPQLICGLSLSLIYTFVFHRNADSLMVGAGLMLILSGIAWFRMSHALSLLKFLRLQTAER